MKNLFIILSVLFSFTGSAKELNLENWLEEEIVAHQNLFASIESEASDTELLLKTVRVRLRATLSAELPLVAKGKIRPEVELFFKR